MKNETQKTTKTETVIPILPSHPDSMNIGSHPDSMKTHSHPDSTNAPVLPEMPQGKCYAVVDLYPSNETEHNLKDAYPEFFLWERSAELECDGRNVAYAGCDVNIVAVTLTRNEYERFCKQELTID
jgi:hypothetical protein